MMHPGLSSSKTFAAQPTTAAVPLGMGSTRKFVAGTTGACARRMPSWSPAVTTKILSAGTEGSKRSTVI